MNVSVKQFGNREEVKAFVESNAQLTRQEMRDKVAQEGRLLLPEISGFNAMGLVRQGYTLETIIAEYQGNTKGVLTILKKD